MNIGLQVSESLLLVLLGVYLAVELVGLSHASKITFKILQARLQQYVNCELPDVQAGFRKGRGNFEAEIKLSTSAGSSKKQKSSRKASISVLLTMSNL